MPYFRHTSPADSPAACSFSTLMICSSVNLLLRMSVSRRNGLYLKSRAFKGSRSPGHFFGEGCLNGHPLRIATTMAVDECVITRLEKATIIATIHNEPEFSELFMSYLLTRNSRIEEDLIDQLFNSSEKRLARLLLLLANFGKEGRPEPIVGKFSQETLAEMIGTTRSRVSFFMNKFRKLGFIEYNGKLEVHNSLLNVVLHDKPEINTRDEAIGAE